MLKRNILKIVMVTSVATFTVLTHHNTIQQKFEFKKQQDIKLKTSEERYNNIYQKYIKPAQEKEVRELAEKKRIEELKRKEKEKHLSRGGNIEEKTFVLTFYTSLDSENGFGAITCTGKKLRDGMVANNVLQLGTKIVLNGYGKVEIADRGGNNFNTEERLDVFIPRKNGENNYQYKKRVNSMGRVKVKGYIIK